MKKGRTPFTPEDDRILAKWVREAERKGIPTKGNELYQQLAEQVHVIHLELPIDIKLTKRFRTLGILPSHGVTAGSSTYLFSRGQNLRMLLLRYRSVVLDQ